MARTLIHAPKTARPGEIIELRATIAHPMETGLRSDDQGRPVPRNILTHFECHYNGQRVFGALLYAAVAANPYLAFHLRAQASGTITLTWHGDFGFKQTESLALLVA